MVTLNVMGQELYIRMKPTFPGAKSGVLCSKPSGKPSIPQLKARLDLAKKAVALTGTKGTVSDAGNGKGGPLLAKKISDQAPGIGAHGGMSYQQRLESKRKGQVGIDKIQRAIQALQ